MASSAASTDRLARSPPRRELGVSARRRNLLGRCEADLDQRSAPRRVLGSRLAVVGVGGLLDDRQPEAGARHAARVAGAIEAVEYVLEIPSAEARAMVSHRQRASMQMHDDRAAGRAPLA